MKLGGTDGLAQWGYSLNTSTDEMLLKISPKASQDGKIYVTGNARDDIAIGPWNPGGSGNYYQIYVALDSSTGSATDGWGGGSSSDGNGITIGGDGDVYLLTNLYAGDLTSGTETVAYNGVSGRSTVLIRRHANLTAINP